MDPRVRAYLDRKYPVMSDREETKDGSELYTAWLVDLPGCIAQGETKAAALERLDALKPAYFAKLIEHGVPIPEPSKEAAIGSKYFGFYDPQTGAMFGLRPATRVRPGPPPTESFSRTAARAAAA